MDNKEILNYATEAAKLQQQKANPEKPSLTRKCQFQGCPLTSTMSGAQGYTCSFHDGNDYHSAVTAAINHNYKLIKSLREMTFWTQDKWSDPKVVEWLQNKPSCPMKEGELVSMYLSRFNQWLHDHIAAESTKSIKGN